MRHSPARPQRTIDLLRPHLDGVSHALDLHPGDPDLRGVVGLPAEVAHVPVTSDIEVSRDQRCLLVTRVAAGADPQEAVGDLDGAAAGARAVVFLRSGLEHAPVLGLGAALADAGWRVLGFGELLYEVAPSAVVAVRAGDGGKDDGHADAGDSGDRDQDGGHADTGDDDLAEHNRRVLERALVPLLLARLEGGEDGDEGDAEHLRDRLAYLERQLDRLRDDAAEHRERERVLKRDLRTAQRKLGQMETSTSYRVGHALVRSTRSPGAAKRLPKELAKALREREAPATTTPEVAEEHAGGAEAQERSGEPAERWRLVDGLTTRFTADVAPSLAVVGTAEFADVLGRHAAVTRLLPHDAALLLERMRPGAVLVQASAVLHGSPWAGGGTSVSVERDRDLAQVLAAASAAGVSTVWWWDAPAASLPLLRSVAATCDVVLSADGRLGPAWAPGADLHHVDVAARGGDGVVHLHTGGPRAPVGLLREALRAAARRTTTRVVVDLLDHPRLADVAVETGAELSVATPNDRYAAYRDAAVVLASPFTSAPDGTDAVGPTLAALLSGARVVSGPNPVLRDLVGDLVTFVDTADELPDALEQALTAAPADDAARWRQLRHLAAVASPYTALRRLGGHLGHQVDPTPQRAVTVVTDLDGDAEPFVAAALAQRTRPQVVVARGAQPGLHDRALAELEAAGIQVIATGPSRGALPLTAPTPWVVRLDAGAELHPDHLHDLLLAAELGPLPDAVGYADRLGPAERLPDTGTLLRAELVRRRGRTAADRWTPLGLRSLGVPRLHEPQATTGEVTP
ncbi:hypothetical protein [Egicoccus sp. AB-alg6-2]|uniref:hypothetical protein n=1 Tax=Egicoccus sp. AB-alg6-2 TaxID=3242692 RepID=UPI00359D1B1B